ncbi:hypothetical protein DAETH_36950 (plasmid) [Deinococcus aetherius]|uniref:ABC transmembrane type-1 domain-containing protein n=1 Tax=Deinococcus aetherius TaxID=200252 RepID=A0ABM8AIV1_9DEIO|nr:hypothetical protein DAETH_36950 [Deinococcus aetherius]
MRRRAARPLLNDAHPLVPYAYLLPHAALFLVFIAFPVGYGLWISLHNWNPLESASPWVGARYYLALLSASTPEAEYFWNALRNTVLFTVLSVPLLVGVSLALALQLQRPIFGRALLRAIFFAPGILSVTVMGLLWKWMFQNQVGLVNVVLEQYLGRPTVNFLTAEGWAWVPLVVGSVWWGVGFNMTLYLAALSNIPHALYEAAELDGAGSWARFRFITWPMLTPTTLFVGVTTALGSLQVFGQIQLITGGGPARGTQSVIGYITEEAFTNNNYSSATAMAFAFGVLMLGLTAAQFRLMTGSLREPSFTARERRPSRWALALTRAWHAVSTGWEWVAARLPKLAPRRSRRAVTARRRPWGNAPRFVLLALQALLFLAPLYWMLSTSFKPEIDTLAQPVQWWPARPTLDNYRDVLSNPDTNILRWTLNSALVALLTTLLTVALCVLTAYPLARMRFRGREGWFWFLLTSLMVPGIVTLIPLYIMMIRLNWIDTYHALLWPALPGVFGVFMLRQFFAAVPRELEEAARLDGANSFQILWRVLVPLSVPALVTLGVFAFMGSWNNYVWPLYVVHGDTQTLPVGLALFSGRYVTDYGKLMAGTAVAAVPALLVYLLGQRYLERGLTVTGLKD